MKLFHKSILLVIFLCTIDIIDIGGSDGKESACNAGDLG